MTSNKNYYELDIKEREEFFVNNGYNVKSFWDFWCNGKDNLVMEVRIKTTFKNIMTFAKENNLPFSVSGVFVKTYEQLLFVISKLRNLYTLWFGVNPKKKSYHKKQPKFKTYNGTDYSIESINHIFIDIDRNESEEGTIATKEDLKGSCNFVENELIPDLNKINITDYMVIYSGNGMQVIIPLDEPLIMPEMEWDLTQNEYTELTEQFLNLQKLVRLVMGVKLTNKYNLNEYQEKYNISIDKSAFNIGRVGAMPYSYNFKNNNKIMRGIYKICKTENKNKGLSDAIYNEIDTINKSPVYNNKIRDMYGLDASFKRTAKNMYKDKLVRYILDNDLPQGGRNDKLGFAFKLLVRDNNIDPNCVQIKTIRKMIEKKWNRHFPFNIPDKNKYKCFDAEMVNNYCIDKLLPLLYPPYQGKVIAKRLPDHTWDWANYKMYCKIENLKLRKLPDKSKTSLKKDILKIAESESLEEVYEYIAGLVDKYDEKTAKACQELYLPAYTAKRIKFKKN